MQESQSQDRDKQQPSLIEKVDLRQTLNDIPEALRDAPDPKASSGQPPIALILGVVGVGAIAVVSGFWYLAQSSQTAVVPPLPVSSPSILPSPDPSVVTSEDTLPSPSPEPVTTEFPDPQADALLGHLPYEEAPAEELAPIVADGSIKLRKAAAAKYREMADAASRDGVALAPISGFRNIDDQNYLFFDIKAQRGQVTTQRAQVSAPPGRSEHHTGYAIDIGDANVPATNLSPDFENTRAFQWLQENAAYYSFELSFPRDNPQGVSYEPWHWRFVGDTHSLETFYKAHNLNQQQNTNE